MSAAPDLITLNHRRDIRNRWLLSLPALLIILLAATGPLLIVLIYSFLTPGDYGDVKWLFSTDAWVNFKLFGGMGLMLVFVLAQGMMLSKYVEDKQ